jgi:hypothetical protein
MSARAACLLLHWFVEGQCCQTLRRSCRNSSRSEPRSSINTLAVCCNLRATVCAVRHLQPVQPITLLPQTSDYRNGDRRPYLRWWTRFCGGSRRSTSATATQHRRLLWPQQQSFTGRRRGIRSNARSRGLPPQAGGWPHLPGHYPQLARSSSRANSTTHRPDSTTCCRHLLAHAAKRHMDAG